MATINTGARSVVEVNGFGSTWEIGDDLTVGEVGFGTLKVLNGGQVVADDVFLGDNLNSRGEAIVDGEFSYLEVNGTLDISAPGEAKLTIADGGFVLSTGITRVNTNGELVLDGGRLHAQIAGGFQNNGLTRGGGTILGAVTNSVTGEIRIEPGDKLLLHNTTTNSGLIDIHAGELEVLGTTTNSNTGDIDVRGGILRFQSGFTNGSGGQFAIVGGDVDAYGSITNNLNAQIVVGGEAQAVFHDAFTNNGSLLVTPGADLLTLDNLNFGSGSITLELADTDPIDGFGQLAVGGTAQVSGDLTVALVEGFAPSAGDSFQIILAATRSGFFATETLPALGGGLDWDVVYSPNSVVLNVVSTATLVGDYNDDGIVDAADYAVWRKLNNTAGPLPNDPTPGINDGDYTQWRAHFGDATPGGGSGGANVPEPSAAIIVLLSFLAAACAIRLRRS
jgi:T5SS/PEP-CTERM-associated repeat protein